MGSCISKIFDFVLLCYFDFYPFVFEGLMKNDIFFSNGILRLRFDMVTRGRYTGIHSINKLPEKMTLAPLQTEV